MQVVEGIAAYKASRNSVVTTGMFDGVHFGHRQLISQITGIAAEQNLECIVLTFWPHPRIIQGSTSLLLLNTLEEKICILRKLGVQTLIIETFDKHFSNLEPLEYIRDVLVGKLRASVIVQGYDHRFGRNRTGNLSTLKKYQSDFGYQIVEVPPQHIEQSAVSSTKVRDNLLSGNWQRAMSYLCGFYPITGTVGHGNKIGRHLGFPTANLVGIHPQKLIPAPGVYAAIVDILGFQHKAVVNIGHRPTVEKAGIRTVEAHLIDFSGELYGQTLTVWLFERLRDEKKFESLEQLKLQIQSDCQIAKSLQIPDFSPI